MYRKCQTSSSRDYFLNRTAANGKMTKIRKMAAPDHETFFDETENFAFLVSFGRPRGADMLRSETSCSLIL